MKKLLIIGVFLNAGFLFAIWQQLSVFLNIDRPDSFSKII